jgi:hypothetical protein
MATADLFYLVWPKGIKERGGESIGNKPHHALGLWRPDEIAQRWRKLLNKMAKSSLNVIKPSSLVNTRKISKIRFIIEQPT